MKVIHTINLLLIAALSLAPSYAPTAPKKELTTYEKIKTLKPRISDLLAQKISSSVEKHCSRHQQSLVLSILFVESSFRPGVQSTTGDIGLGQISPGARLLYNLEGERLRGIQYNTRWACKILAKQRKWWEYHSRTPSRAKAYKAKIKAQVQKIQAAEKGR